MNKKNNRLTLILLIISLCFNMFFAGGYLFSRRILKQLKTPEGRAQLLVRRLKLSPAQQDLLLQLREQLQIQATKSKQTNRADIDAFWQEIAKDNPDSLKIENLLERASQARKEYMVLASKIMREFLCVLSTEQRWAYVEILRKNRYLKQ